MAPRFSPNPVMLVRGDAVVGRVVRRSTPYDSIRALRMRLVSCPMPDSSRQHSGCRLMSSGASLV